LGLAAQARELYQYREAIRNLVIRDLKVRYSRSALGIVWSFFNPLLMTLVYSLVFSLLASGDVPGLPVFVLAGLLPWNFLSASLLGATSAVTSNGQLINRVYFPREILPVSVIIASGINFLISLGLLFGFMLIYRTPIGLALFWLPAVMGLQLLLVVGLGLFLASVNVYLRDTQQIVDVLVLAWFFLTPIIYSLDVITNPSLRLLVQALNPMASLVTAYRAVLYAGVGPNLALLALTGAQALLALLVGAVVFRRLSPGFAEEI
jgi:lipopolysaccharide transport system permease protein